ncbi:GNAT family N-acetyltransferase [Kocuria tytonis]|uniref:GNAT family N-acetyltransferase n=1 Tax=Kocuria tytonis TaxID=2054280 RepID=A0A495AAC4_9MICC|nr:GNAT family N-acetyltransferase [Kocuria tytonis]RKQ36958.1 GNAT family N-acetyltransferase [Kocuria tytonis]
MTQSSPVRIELLRIPDSFDEDAQRLLGDVAELVKSSRRHVWGTGQLSNEAHDIFRDLNDPYERIKILCAFVAGRLVGRAEVRMPLIANTEAAQIVVHVAPDETSEGIGRELLGAAEQLAHGESRRLVGLVTEHPASEIRDPSGPGDGSADGSAEGGTATSEPVEWLEAADGSGRLPASHRQTRFAQHAGYELRTVSSFALLSVPLDAGRSRRIQESLAATPFAEHYRMHTWVGEAPEELLSPLAQLHSKIPTDSFVRPVVADPDPWDAARVRRTEQLRQEDGDRSLMAVVQDLRSGELVGMTELILAQHRPTLALQDETLVVRAHRGHRLGMRLKLANLEQLAAVAPEVDTVYSWTHSGNDRMNWVNARLGFRDAGQSAIWEQDFSIR